MPPYICIHTGCINIQIILSGFTERSLVHNIRHAAVFTLSYACVAMKRKGKSILMCWPKDFFLFDSNYFIWEHCNFSKGNIFIWCKKNMWKTWKNSIFDKSWVWASPCLFKLFRLYIFFRVIINGYLYLMLTIA